MSDDSRTETTDLVHYHARDLTRALEEALGVLVGCVVAGPGCDDARDLAMAIERGEEALAAAGILKVREVLP